MVNSLATSGENLQGLATEVEATGFGEANQGQIEAALDLPGLTSNPFENPTWLQVASGSPECTKLSDEMTAQLAPSE